MELHRIARLDAVIEFLDQPFFEFAIDRAVSIFWRITSPAIACSVRSSSLRLPRSWSHGRVDARVLNLDGDFLAALEPGAMDLAERGGGESLRFETGEQLLGTLAEIRGGPVARSSHSPSAARRRAWSSADRSLRPGSRSSRIESICTSFMNAPRNWVRTFDDAPGIADMGIEQFALVARGVEEGLAERSPQVAGADLRGEAAHLHLRGACARRGRFVRLLGHQSPPRASPTRLISVAAKAAPKPLSMFTTVTPLAHC